MHLDNLGVVEKKVLGALLILADENNIVNATYKDIANIMGYKEVGGVITFAMKILEQNNFIVKLQPKKYKVLL